MFIAHSRRTRQYFDSTNLILLWFDIELTSCATIVSSGLPNVPCYFLMGEIFFVPAPSARRMARLISPQLPKKAVKITAASCFGVHGWQVFWLKPSWNNQRLPWEQLSDVNPSTLPRVYSLILTVKMHERLDCLGPKAPLSLRRSRTRKQRGRACRTTTKFILVPRSRFHLVRYRTRDR